MTQFPGPESRIAPPRKRGIPLVTLPSIEAQEYERPRVGETIAQFVERTGWGGRGLPVVVGEIMPDGECEPILRARWTEKVRRRRLVVIARPLGGGGQGSRQLGAVMAMIALIVVANVAAPAIGGALGGTLGIGAKAWTSIASALVVAGGSMLISHFMSPKSGAKGEPETLYTASLSGNRARPQQPIPVHYGRLKFNPDFSGSPWAEFSGKDQIFHAEYVLGIGEFVIHEIGVGDTPIWTAADGNLDGFEKFQHQMVGPGENLTLFPVNAVTASEVSGQEFPDPDLPEEGGAINWIGPFVVNPAGSVGREVSIDVAFPGGCFYQNPDDGKINYASHTLRVEYRYVDDAGVPIGGVGAGYNTLFTRTFSAASQAPVRFTHRVNLPVAGRIQVRAAVLEKSFRNNGTNVMIWVGARMFLQGPNARPNVSRMAIRMVADEQLSGYSQQNLYVIATRKIPVWSGTAWVLTATQNPIWPYVDMWANDLYGGGMPLGKADLVTLLQEANDADTRGETFNHRFTSQDTVLALLTSIAQSIGAKPVILWDVLSIHRDKPALLPERVFTDFEIVRGSFSGSWMMQDDDSSDGTIVEYIEEQIWQPADAPSAATVTELLKPARVQIPGVTKRAQAVRLARLLANANKLRRKEVEITVLAEGKVLRYGMCVAAQSSIPTGWGAAGRVEIYSPGSRTVVLRDNMPWDLAAASHYIRVRQRNGRNWGPVKVTRGGADNIAVVDAADLAAVQGAQGVLLTDAIFRDQEEDDATIAFSVGEPREFIGLIAGVKNAGENRFRVTLVPQELDVYETGAPIPVLPPPPPLSVPTMPGEIQNVNVSYVQEGLSLRLSATWQPDAGSNLYQAQISYDEGDTWLPVYSNGADPLFTITGLTDNDLWLRVRGVRRTGTAADIPGPWTVPYIIESPGIVRTAEHLNLTVDYTDLTEDAQQEIQDAIDASVGGVSAEFTAALAAEAIERGLIADALAAEVTDRADGDDALASSISALTVTVGANTAAISTEATARADADDAAAVRIDALEVTVDDNTAAIASEAIARADADSALGGRIDTVEVSVGDAEAAISAEALARADADSAAASRMDSIEADVGANSAAISAEATARADADSAAALVVSALAADVGDNAAAISNEALARADGDSALAGEIATINATTDDLAAAISSEAIARADADDALASQIDTVSAIASAAGRVYHQNSPPASPQNGWLWIEKDNGNKRWVWDSVLSQWVDATDAAIGIVAAAVTSEATARADADDAIALQVDAVEAKTDAGTAEGRIRFGAAAGAGDVAAFFHLEVKATPSGSFPGSFASAGMKVAVKTDGTSEIVFLSNSFKIQTTSANIAPFAVVGADVYLQGVTRVAQTIRSANVNTAGVPFMQVDFENGRIIISDNT